MLRLLIPPKERLSRWLSVGWIEILVDAEKRAVLLSPDFKAVGTGVFGAYVTQVFIAKPLFRPGEVTPLLTTQQCEAEHPSLIDQFNFSQAQCP